MSFLSVGSSVGGQTLKTTGHSDNTHNALYIGLSTLRTNVNIPLKDTICIGTQR